MNEQYEPFAARVFFFANGDLVVKQCAKRNCVYHPTGKERLVKLSPNQTEQVMELLRQARGGKLGE